MAQKGGVGNTKKNLLAGGQTALAAVQYVRLNLWICQNLCENCTVLLVPYLVPYDHFWGRYSNSKKVVKRSLNIGRTLYISRICQEKFNYAAWMAWIGPWFFGLNFALKKYLTFLRQYLRNPLADFFVTYIQVHARYSVPLTKLPISTAVMVVRNLARYH